MAEWSVDRRISGSMRKDEKAAPNARALIPKRDPLIECHCVHCIQPSRPARVPDREATLKTGLSYKPQSETSSCDGRGPP